MRVGSLERGVQWGWQVCWVEGWLGRVLWQRREREEDIGKKCSTALISNFGFITTVLCTKPLKFHFSNNTLRVASVFSKWNFDYHYKRQRQESGKTQRQCKLTLRAVFFFFPIHHWCGCALWVLLLPLLRKYIHALWVTLDLVILLGPSHKRNIEFGE